MTDQFKISALLEKKKMFVLDMDGTIYLGNRPLDGAREFIRAARNNGIRILYFTNNASKNIGDYYEKLAKLDFPCDKGDVVSSANVTADFLKKHHPGASVYLVGTPALEAMFTAEGIDLTDGSHADIVVSSFDTTLTYEKLVKACDLIRGGALFYSTHPDNNCPTETGFIPDSGAICALIERSTGVAPRYFGKPHLETAHFLASYSGLSFDEMAVAGDRLYTDVALGRNYGITSILVLTGESRESDVSENNAPDIILDRLGDLSEILHYN